MVRVLRPLLTIIAIMVSTLALDIFGSLLWLFLRPWNRGLYHSLLGKVALARWLESNDLLLPDTKYVLHGAPLNLHMAKSLAQAQSGSRAANGMSSGDSTPKSSLNHPDQAAAVAAAAAPPASVAELYTGIAAGETVSPLSILISNHQVDLDWLYLWEASRFFDAHSTMKVILKENLKYIPLIGYAMYLLEFLFLKRDWESDRSNLERRLRHFARDHVPVILILFPEGTTINTRALEKSHTYSREKQRPNLDLVLLPRTTGFEACLKSLGSGHHIIYDVTMAFSGYTGEVPTYEMGYERSRDVGIPNAGKVLMGHKTEVHLDVRAIPSTEILEKHPSIEKWLDERFARKDRLLKYFAEHQQFPVDEVGPARKATAKGKFSSLVELWSVVLLSGIILPFALVMFIPYAMIVTLSYSYIKWHEYTQIMLSREERRDYRETVKNTVMKGVVLGLMVLTIMAWMYSSYSLVINVIAPALGLSSASS